ADAFEQRMGLVGGLFQHTAIEMQPGQLPIDESLGTGHKVECDLLGSRGGRRGRDGFLFHDNDLAAISHDGKKALVRGRMAALDDSRMTYGARPKSPSRLPATRWFLRTLVSIPLPSSSQGVAVSDLSTSAAKALVSGR